MQGVGFRWWTHRQASALGLTGYARNLPDGRVEVVAEGDRAACARLLDALRSGRTPGSVRTVSESWSPATGEHADFREL